MGNEKAYISHENALLLFSEGINFDKGLFEFVLKKTLVRYSKGKTGPSPSYFVGSVKREKDKCQLLAANKLKLNRSNNHRTRKRTNIPEYILVQVERDREEERQFEQAQLTKSSEEIEKDILETEQLIKKLSSEVTKSIFCWYRSQYHLHYDAD